MLLESHWIFEFTRPANQSSVYALQEMWTLGLIIPTMQRQQGGAQANGGVAYEGATVIEPNGDIIGSLLPH